jgi:hypothetical protein
VQLASPQKTQDWDRIREILAHLLKELAAVPMNEQLRTSVESDLAAAAAQARTAQPDVTAVRPLLQAAERSLSALDTAGGALAFINSVTSVIGMLY